VKSWSLKPLTSEIIDRVKKARTQSPQVRLDETRSLLALLTQARGAPGFEKPVAEIIRSRLSRVMDGFTDSMGNVIHSWPGNRAEKTGSDSGPTVICAHMDEVGFMVSSIREDGLLRVAPLGGWRRSTLPGSRMEVLGEKGPVTGIFGAISPHFLPNREEPAGPVDYSELYLDIGASDSREVQRLGVSIGDPITPQCASERIGKGRFMAKALDDRAGCCAMILTMERLAELFPSNCGQRGDAPIIAAATVQEEVGSRGSRALAWSMKPSLVIILEGSPADDLPQGPEAAQGCLGKGPQIRLLDQSTIYSPELAREMKTLAAKMGMGCQMTVRSNGSTDAGQLHTAWGGCPATVIGIPVRYAHGPIGILELQDLVDSIDLLTAFLAERLLTSR